MTIKIILDANFLFIPSQFQIDIFDELMKLLNQRFEPILLSPTYKELQKIAEKGSPKMRQHASLALKLAEKCRLVEVKQDFEETHDDVIVRVAAEWKCPVATNDQALRKRLRDINVSVIYLRQRSHLEMEGNVP
ncbi:30S processome protein Utp24 [Candidatus Bathyarchaeota archaeon]|nr:MAG: 30S processome protein Utp24 [Candidatus Bathyarchaeota archaeon]